MVGVFPLGPGGSMVGDTSCGQTHKVKAFPSHTPCVGGNKTLSSFCHYSKNLFCAKMPDLLNILMDLFCCKNYRNDSSIQFLKILCRIKFSRMFHASFRI